MIQFKNVSKVYQHQTVLKNINLTIQDNEFFVLVGASGSGKTTTLKLINRLIEPTVGDIYKNGKRVIDHNLRELRLGTGYVLQQGALFPNLTVYENIALIPEMKKWDKQQIKTRTCELLKRVGLDPDRYLERLPKELSGGEQQRIGILRALITHPDVILMDEPFSALDPISRQQLQTLMKELHQDFQMTVVFVTHDMREAMLLGDRICVMQAGEILQIDAPEVIQKYPANQAVADLMQGGIYD